MHLDRTKALISHGVDLVNPLQGLTHVLESALELVSLPENDFTWSFWEDAAEAKAEIQEFIAQIASGVVPSKVKVSVLFVPGGPLQEVSLCSGWAEQFLKVAERFDEVESHVW